MRRIFSILFLGSIGVALAAPYSAQAAQVFCFCADRIEGITVDNYKEKDEQLSSTGCISVEAELCSPEKADKNRRYGFCDRTYGSLDECVKDSSDVWNSSKKAAIQKASQSEEGLKSKTSKFIPDCALQNDLGPGSPCRDVSIFVVLAIEASRYLFSIIGALALVMFIYGGFELVISEGNPEKLTKAKDILVAVVLGLLISFSGYLLISFLQESVGVSQEFRLLR